MSEPSALINLQTENARLIALLEAHGIEWRIPQKLRNQEINREVKTVKVPSSFRLNTKYK
jgi:hypothetical protein